MVPFASSRSWRTKFWGRSLRNGLGNQSREKTAVNRIVMYITFRRYSWECLGKLYCRHSMKIFLVFCPYSEFFWIKVKRFSEFHFTAKFWVFSLKKRFRMAGEDKKSFRHFYFKSPTDIIILPGFAMSDDMAPYRMIQRIRHKKMIESRTGNNKLRKTP